MKERVLIGPSTFAAIDKQPLEALKADGLEVILNPFGRKLSKDELLGFLPRVKGLLAGLEPLDKEVLEKSELKVISRCGSGLDNVDLIAAKNLGIKVYSTPDAPVAAVAELVVGALISLLRFLAEMNNDLHSGKWAKKIGAQLSGKTVVIIGFGRIGRYVAGLLKPFGAKIDVTQHWDSPD